MKKFPSVLHIIDSIEPGGAEKVTITLANIFQERGHHVGLLYFNKTKVDLNRQIMNGVEIIHFERGIKYNPLISKNIKNYINKFDIIHIHLRYNLKYYCFLNFFHRFNKLVVFHDHFGNIMNDESISWFEKLYMKNTVYVCVSHSLMNWAKRNGFKRIFLFENIIIREKNLYSNNNSDRMIIVGNIHERKNQIFALRLLKRILQHNNVCLDIYGKIVDVNYYSTLRNYIQKNNLDNNVKFIFNCTQIQKILHKYSIAIHCSHSETGPLVLLEYMAQGLPFVTKNTGQVINYLKPELDYFIINDFSIEHWVDAIELVQSKPQNELKGKMINIFYQICSPDNYYKKCLRIYTENTP